MDTLPNIHPGEILKLDFLMPLNITATKLARDIGVGSTRIAQILRGERAITIDTAMRLGRYFNTSPQLWLNLQREYDLEEWHEKHCTTYQDIHAYNDNIAEKISA